MVERYVRDVEAVGSNPVTSTILSQDRFQRALQVEVCFFFVRFYINPFHQQVYPLFVWGGLDGVQPALNGVHSEIFRRLCGFQDGDFCLDLLHPLPDVRHYFRGQRTSGQVVQQGIVLLLFLRNALSLTTVFLLQKLQCSSKQKDSRNSVTEKYISTLRLVYYNMKNRKSNHIICCQ